VSDRIHPADLAALDAATGTSPTCKLDDLEQGDWACDSDGDVLIVTDEADDTDQRNPILCVNAKTGSIYRLARDTGVVRLDVAPIRCRVAVPIRALPEPSALEALQLETNRLLREVLERMP
jgi:hypothetical protein